MLIDVRETSRSVEPHRHRVIYVVGRDSQLRRTIAGRLRALPNTLLEGETLTDVDLVGTQQSSAVVVLLAEDQSALYCTSDLRTFRARDAATTILLAATTAAKLERRLGALARAGLDDLLVLNGEDSLDALRRLVSRRLTATLPWAIVHSVVPAGDSDANRILGLCIRLGDRPHSAEDIAHWLQWDRKTIYRRVSEEALRPISDLINIGRLLQAATLLDERSGAIGVIAERLGFDSASTLRRLIKRETGCTPKELRERGAINAVVALASGLIRKLTPELIAMH